MYKDKKFHIRPLADILEDIRLAQTYYQDVVKVFLADGDALCMTEADLTAILNSLYAAFSSLAHVGVYASPNSILDKSPEALKRLKAQGMTIAYLGVETGDPQLLQDIKKGVTVEEMVQAGKKVREAGIQLSATIILGLAGRTSRALPHAIHTGEILSRMNPDYVGALTLMLEPGTILYRRMQQGEFELPGAFEILDELKIILEHCELQDTEFRSNHASNYLPVKGRFPQDKQKMVQMIDRIIQSGDSRYLRPDYLRAL
jgi:radical SAM superfamily enzyme YgiQ (UPF0313 family)